MTGQYLLQHLPFPPALPVSANKHQNALVALFAGNGLDRESSVLPSISSHTHHPISPNSSSFAFFAIDKLSLTHAVSLSLSDTHTHLWTHFYPFLVTQKHPLTHTHTQSQSHSQTCIHSYTPKQMHTHTLSLTSLFDSITFTL